MQELVRRYIAGTYVFREGEAGNDAFVLRTGKVRLFRVKGPREIQLDEFVEGRLFGESALVERAPRVAGAIAVTNSECYAIDRREYNARIARLDPSRLRALRNLHIFVHRVKLHDAEGRRIVGAVPEDVEKTVRALVESDLGASLAHTGDELVDLVAGQILLEAKRRLPAPPEDEETARQRERLRPRPAAHPSP
ncbi:MAG: cyclic nucleotide-binding domain-containing protein [Rhodospirillales bacterium]|nr:cyclic nucleotide-binding domain-containing protein [Rhodospirillales bacterium]